MTPRFLILCGALVLALGVAAWLALYKAVGGGWQPVADTQAAAGNNTREAN